MNFMNNASMKKKNSATSITYKKNQSLKSLLSSSPSQELILNKEEAQIKHFNSKDDKKFQPQIGTILT